MVGESTFVRQLLVSVLSVLNFYQQQKQLLANRLTNQCSRSPLTSGQKKNSCVVERPLLRRRTFEIQPFFPLTQFTHAF